MFIQNISLQAARIPWPQVWPYNYQLSTSFQYYLEHPFWINQVYTRRSGHQYPCLISMWNIDFLVHRRKSMRWPLFFLSSIWFPQNLFAVGSNTYMWCSFVLCLVIVVHLVFLRYLEQNFEELGKKQQSLKSIFKTRKLRLAEEINFWLETI